MRRMLIALCLFAGACGGGGSAPTSPAPVPTIPLVAGVYNATWRYQIVQLSNSANVTLTCPGTVTLAQIVGCHQRDVRLCRRPGLHRDDWRPDR